MAIRFYCNECDQLLSIASRKAGTQVACPTCGSEQTVPTQQAAAAAMAMARSAAAAERVESEGSPLANEGGPSVIGRPGYGGSNPGAPVPPPLTGSPSWARLEPARPMPPGTILYRRRTLYVHGLLFLLLAAGAFGAGYFIGRGDAIGVLRFGPKEPGREPVLVEGKLYYEAAPGRVAPDVDAVIVALPAQKLPEATLSTDGLRPRDPPPPPDSRSVRKIEELGGAYGRADDSGTFRVVIPGPGRYRVLLISRATGRAAETPIDPLDLSEITRYFYRAADLIGTSKYDWTLEEITAQSPAIEHDFGRDGGG